MRLPLSLLLLTVLSAAAQTSSIVFLGSNPSTLGPSPVAALDVSGLGVDAAGNQYYADTASGTVIEVTTAQTQIILASDLKHPLIAVDFRGNVFVADTGNNRVFKIAAGAKHSVFLLARAMALRAIAVDAADNAFFSSGNSIVEVPNNGTPTLVTSVAGASLLAFGPAANGTNHLYIVAQQSNSYSAYLYSYSSTARAAGALSGPLAGFLPAISSGSIGSFAVDPHGNAVVVNDSDGTAQVILGTSSGFQQTLYTSQAATTTIAEDANGSMYFVDTPGLEQIQLGAVNFGNAQAGADGTDRPVSIQLNFGAPANATYTANQQPSVRNFQAPDVPQLGTSPSSVIIDTNPETAGLITGTLTLTDQDNRTLNIPLYGTSLTPWETIYPPAPDLRSQHGTTKPVVVINEPQCECGTYILDAATGQVTLNGNVVASGLKNPVAMDVDADQNIYVTQSGVAGVLRISADGSKTRIATDLAKPLGVALDGARNLYVANGDDIMKVMPDGMETIFASPETDGGYTSAISVAVDVQNNLYAGLKGNPHYSRGAILKFTPVGVAEELHVNVMDPASLSAAHTSVLFFTDAARGTVNAYSTNLIQKTLAFGLSDPVGISASRCGCLAIADPGLGTIVNIAGGVQSLSFGTVQKGSSRTTLLTALSVGTQTANFDVVNPSGESNPNYMPNAPDTEYASPAGSLTEIPFTFTPTLLGPIPYQYWLVANNDNQVDPSPSILNVTGTGLAEPGSASFALTLPPAPVFGRLLTMEVSALNRDLTVNTDFNGAVMAAYTGPTVSFTVPPATGSVPVTLTHGMGSFSFKFPNSGVYTFVLSGGGMSTTINVNIVEARTRIKVTGSITPGATAPMLSATASVEGQFGLIPDSYVYFVLDNNYAIYLPSVYLVNGVAALKAALPSNLSTGNHTLTALYIPSLYPNFLPSQVTITIPYNPSQ